MNFGNWRGKGVGVLFCFVFLIKLEALSFSAGNFQFDLVYNAAEDFFDFSRKLFLNLSQFGVG